MSKKDEFINNLSDSYTNSTNYIKNNKKLVIGIFLIIILVTTLSSILIIYSGDDTSDSLISTDNETISEENVDEVENLRVNIHDDEINNTKTITDTKELEMSITHDSIDSELQYRWSINDGYESLESTDGQDLIFEFKSDVKIDGSIDRDTYYVTAYVDDIENNETYDKTITINVDEPDEDTIDEPDEPTEVNYCEEITGDGTIDNPYEISNSDELNCINSNDEFDELDAHYIQTSDIDLSNSEDIYGNTGFDPIGSYSSTGDSEKFTGSYNGQGYTINNFRVSDAYDNSISVGLFRVTENAELKNINFDNVDVNGGPYTGTLVGISENTDIDNIQVKGNIDGDRNVGGLIGRNIDGSIYNVNTDININSNGDSIGGVIGYNTGIVQYSSSDGTIEGNEQVGGLIGYNNDGDAHNVYSTVDTTGEAFVGGLIGRNSDSSVSQAYSTGVVDGGEEWRVGALIGSNSDSEVVDVYWDMDSSTLWDGVGYNSGEFDGEGLSTSEMQGNSAEDNMSGFDFENTWITVDSEYPELK